MDAWFHGNDFQWNVWDLGLSGCMVSQWWFSVKCSGTWGWVDAWFHSGDFQWNAWDLGLSGCMVSQWWFSVKCSGTWGWVDAWFHSSEYQWNALTLGAKWMCGFITVSLREMQGFWNLVLGFYRKHSLIGGLDCNKLQRCIHQVLGHCRRLHLSQLHRHIRIG